MFFKLLKADRLKLKHSPIWLAFFFMPIIPALLGTLNYLNNLDLLESTWYSLWTQHTLFTCYFFLPIMLGIYCSYLMRLEQNNQNWNKLLSLPVPVYQIFLSKFTIASFMLLLSEIWIGFLFILSGKLAGITVPLPKELISWLLCGTLGGMVMTAAQCLLSLVIRSFALPIGLSLAGDISGLVALAKGFGHLYPYSLMSYGMRANAPQTLMEGGNLFFVCVCLFYLLLFLAAGSIYLSKHDA